MQIMEMQNELISVIIPVYNTENYLPQCLESILRQTHSNLEIIVVNDGSTDASGTVADRFFLKDSRIKVIHKENSGVSSARNAGLAAAKGKWFSFIDSDDTIEENYFETLLANALEHDADISFGISNTVDDEDEPPTNPTVKAFSSDEATIHLLKADYFGYAVNKLYRRDLWGDIRFPIGIRKNEDLFVNYLLFQKAKTIVYTNARLYNYTHRIGSASRSGYNQSLFDAVKITQKIMDFDTANDAIRDIAEARWVSAIISVFRGAVLAKDKKTQEELIGIVRESGKLHIKHIRKNEEISSANKAQIRMIYRFPALYKCLFMLRSRLKSLH